MNQFDDDVTEYLSLTKDLYKDLVSVAKDTDTGEIKTQSLVFKINSIVRDGGPNLSAEEHP